MEGQGTARGLVDRGGGKSATNQARARGTREPSEVRGLTELNGAEGAWSQGRAKGSEGLGGVRLGGLRYSMWD